MTCRDSGKTAPGYCVNTKTSTFLDGERKTNLCQRSRQLVCKFCNCCQEAPQRGTPNSAHPGLPPATEATVPGRPLDLSSFCSGQGNRPLPLARSLSLTPRARALQEVCLPGHSHLLFPEMRAGRALFVFSQRGLPEHILGVASLRRWGQWE